MANPLIRLLQVEISRQGMPPGYRPQTALPYIDLTPKTTTQVQPNISNHATQVAKLWQDHGGAALVAQWFLCELSSFDLNLKQPGRSFDPALLDGVHVVIMPCAENWESVSNIGIQKLEAWAEVTGALVLKSPADLGQGFYQFPSQAVGDNILTVASSTTGSETTGMPPVDLFFPVDWNSYAQPAMLSAGGILALIDFVLRSGAAYSPKAIRELLISTGSLDAKGRKLLNGGVALAQARQALPAPPAPISAPIAPVPAPPAPPVVAPVPPPTTVTGQPASGSKPVITRFDNGVTSAWSSPSQPTTFYFGVTGADKLTLTDPKGVSRDVTGRTSLQVTGVYTAGFTWTLVATNAFGSASISKSGVHGCF